MGGAVSIQGFLGEDYLKKFRVFHPDTLFPPDFSLLLQDRGPLCTNKLKYPRVRKIAYCRGKKHGKPFFISLTRLDEIKRQK